MICHLFSEDVFMGKIKHHLSIGLPVFNGEKYLREALSSIITQTYEDFELIICDNASTDSTPKICREFSKKDHRIKYYQNKRNFGGPVNHNLTFRLSSGDYFKWAAYDDILTPEYLQRCVEILDNDPSVVLCHSKVGRIDETGTLVGNYDKWTLKNISSWKPHERFADMLNPTNTCWAIHGIMRRSSLKQKTNLHGDYIGSDRNLLAELALLGRVFEVSDHLILRRDHPQTYTHKYYSKAGFRDYRTQLVWWKGEKNRRLLVLPNWKNCLEYFNSIDRVPLKWSEKLLCYREIGRWLLRARGLRLLKWDLANEFQFWRTRLLYG